ncbi:AsmA family protein [Alcaligenaceae bacterium]|nr:AsmA family protein [Alcaligenaceae bacterium]
MPRYAKIILWAGAGLVLLIALAFAVLATFDWNSAKPWVNRQASELAGRPVAVNGDLEIDWRDAGAERGWKGWVPWPYITASDVTVGNPEGSPAAREMARVSRLSALINPVALLGHTVQIASLEIEKADILLQREADGAANWTFKKDEDENKQPSKWVVDLQEISLQSVHAQVVDAASKLDMTADLDTLEDTDGEGYGIGWKASGSYNDADVSGEGKTGGILSLREGSDPFPVRGSVNVGTTTIGLEGSVTRPQALASLDVRLKLAGETMADLFPILGIALPNTPPYSTEGRLIAMLEGEDDTWRYEEFKGIVGKSDLNGTLVFHAREPRSLLTGEVESKLLRFEDLGPLVGADTSDVKSSKDKEVKQPSGKALPVEPINTEPWGAMDADVKFKGLKIVRGKDLPLDHIEAHVKMANSILTFTPLNFGVAGGTLANTITLDGSGQKIKARLNTAARHLKLKQLFPGAESMDASFGELHGDIELSAEGGSIAELLGRSNGELKALVSRGTISQFLLEAAGLNVANMVLVKLFGDEQIVLNCLAADFNVKNGVMTAQAFRMETADAVVDITGTINLAKETLDLDIKPANKTVRIFTLRSPLYARGSFKNPDVGVQTGPLAARAGAAILLGVVATPFAALVPLLNVGTDESAGCATLEAAAKEDPKAPPPGQEKKASDESAAEKAAARGDDEKEKKKDTATNDAPATNKPGAVSLEPQPHVSEQENWPAAKAQP